ncbi:MAG: CHRD domain-containing protein [Proteobacteria bacterium]|nr:CHRD domain-containing protein [Pseudomonadota bacterium]HQR04775.1 CHRD domain-containing protein [Rhodocyclaceae bacterium]
MDTRNPLPFLRAALLGLLLALTGSCLAAETTYTLAPDPQSADLGSGATGSAEFDIRPNGHITGLVRASGLDASVAHIHVGAVGEKGPVAVFLVKVSDSTFATAVDTYLDKTHYADYLAGKLYVDVHSRRYEGGEIRAQLTPPATTH